MGKSKPVPHTEGKKNAKDGSAKILSTVKQGAITKPSNTPKPKSAEVAKQAVKAKEATKQLESKAASSDESDADEDDSDSDDNSDSVSSTSDEDEEEDSETEVPAAPATTNGVKANGVAGGKVSGNAKSSEASDTSESSESSEEDSEDEVAADSTSKSKPPVVNGKQAKASAEKITAKTPKGESDSDSDSDSDESDNGDEEKATTTSTKVEKKDSKLVSSDDKGDDDGSEDSSDASDSDSDSASDSSSDDDSKEEEAPPKKRKAETEIVPTPKKAKTEGLDDALKCNLFVGRLSFNVDDEWLAREFESFGELSRVQVMVDRESGRSRGFAYVEFANAADGEKAQSAMNGAEIDGRPVNVDFSKPKAPAPSREDRAQQYGDRTLSPPSSTIFVANIAFAATSEVIGSEFGKHGDVVGVRLPTDKDTGNPKGFGYVEFSSIEEAQKAFDKLSGKAILGRVPRLDYSTPRDNSNSNGFSRGGARGGRGGGDRGRGRGRGGFDRGGRGGRGGGRGDRGGTTNRGGFGDFQGKKMTLS